VLYTLTIITSVFVPLQFLTGIYGYVDINSHNVDSCPWPSLPFVRFLTFVYISPPIMSLLVTQTSYCRGPWSE
jgi:Mg2+ and Co2+ transporter CorA